MSKLHAVLERVEILDDPNDPPWTKITISTRARVLGQWAAHPTIGDESWTVSHVHTGLAAEKGITRAQAIAAVRELQSVPEFTSADQCTPEIADGIKAALRIAVGGRIQRESSTDADKDEP